MDEVVRAFTNSVKAPEVDADVDTPVNGFEVEGPASSTEPTAADVFPTIEMVRVALVIVTDQAAGGPASTAMARAAKNLGDRLRMAILTSDTVLHQGRQLHGIGTKRSELFA